MAGSSPRDSQEAKKEGKRVAPTFPFRDTNPVTLLSSSRPHVLKVLLTPNSTII
jgi:hypothetical protein